MRSAISESFWENRRADGSPTPCAKPVSHVIAGGSISAPEVRPLCKASAEKCDPYVRHRRFRVLFCGRPSRSTCFSTKKMPRGGIDGFSPRCPDCSPQVSENCSCRVVENLARAQAVEPVAQLAAKAATNAGCARAGRVSKKGHLRGRSASSKRKTGMWARRLSHPLAVHIATAKEALAARSRLRRLHRRHASRPESFTPSPWRKWVVARLLVLFFAAS